VAGTLKSSLVGGLVVGPLLGPIRPDPRGGRRRGRYNDDERDHENPIPLAGKPRSAPLNHYISAHGFVAIPPDAWEIAAEALAFGGEWPEVCVVADLRWWVDQVTARRRACLPTIRDLCARWSWSRRRVAGILAAPESWADPKRGGLDQAAAVLSVLASRAPKWKSGTGRDRTGTGWDQPDTEYQALAEANGTGPGQDGTGAGHTRAFPLPPGSHEEQYMSTSQGEPDHNQEQEPPWQITEPSHPRASPDSSTAERSSIETQIAPSTATTSPPPSQPSAAGKVEQLALVSPAPTFSTATTPPASALSLFPETKTPQADPAWRRAFELLGDLHQEHQGTAISARTWQKPITQALKAGHAPEDLAAAYRHLLTAADTDWWRQRRKGVLLLASCLATQGDQAARLAGWVEAGRAMAAPATAHGVAAAEPNVELETAAQGWQGLERAMRNGRKLDHLSAKTKEVAARLWGSPSQAINLLYAASDFDLNRTYRPAFEAAFRVAP